MPHCIVEHSSNLEINPVIESVFSATLESGLFGSDGKNIKVRAISYKNFRIDKSQSSFIHVAVKILSGRTPEQKSFLSQGVLNKICSNNLSSCSVTVEIVDIDQASYAKELR